MAEEQHRLEGDERGQCIPFRTRAGYWLFLTATPGKPADKSTDVFTSPVYAVIDA